MVPAIELNNGVHMPRLGLGVYKIPDDEVERAVHITFESGYRSAGGQAEKPEDHR
ncbi:MAG TPA: hypothetical protein VJT49_03045 [Amycolatopsis sp.]|uniref:hypothetical protein n=1 Tax=Amycolatopsis sp. TaxID=37632 RepID=UPI002B482250|nr:hypothetical protein [Amycolatopsis sp.]HKS44092.1 hypothetical protein [Amycolatopsis sp.]